MKRRRRHGERGLQCPPRIGGPSKTPVRRAALKQLAHIGRRVQAVPFWGKRKVGNLPCRFIPEASIERLGGVTRAGIQHQELKAPIARLILQHDNQLPGKALAAGVWMNQKLGDVRPLGLVWR